MIELGSGNTNSIECVSYKQIAEYSYVRVHVPIRNITRKDAYNVTTESGAVNVPAHLLWGDKIPNTRITMFRHYFVSERQQGRDIVAVIRIIEKVMQTGHKYLLLDIHPQHGVRPQRELHFSDNGVAGVPIPMTAMKLWFKEIENQDFEPQELKKGDTVSLVVRQRGLDNGMLEEMGGKKYTVTSVTVVGAYVPCACTPIGKQHAAMCPQAGTQLVELATAFGDQLKHKKKARKVSNGWLRKVN